MYAILKKSVDAISGLNLSLPNTETTTGLVIEGTSKSSCTNNNAESNLRPVEQLATYYSAEPNLRQGEQSAT